MSSEKLKDLIKVGDTFFFASDDKRENNRWLKTFTVTKVGSKFFYVNRGYGDDLKCQINESEYLLKQGILVKVCVEAGAYIFGYKDEKSYLRQMELKKLSIKLMQVSFFEDLPEELKDELYEKLKGYIEN